MREVIILTDSTCDLSQELLQQRNIHFIPLKVCFNEQMYKDVVEINTTEMYSKVEELGILPKTAAATILEFEEIFTKYVNEGYDVVYTGIGGKLSSSYQNAVICKQNLDDEIAQHIYVVDSQSLSTGIGLTVLKMADLRDQGKQAQEIVAEAEKIVKCVRAQFSVKDLTFLHIGGRCSGTSRFFGTMLRIRPILRVFDGQIILSEKSFGRYENALNLQIQDLVSNIDNVDTDYLFITHTSADAEAKYIYDNIPTEIKAKFKNIYTTNAGCVVSAHCGKHTIGVLYIKKEPLTSDK